MQQFKLVKGDSKKLNGSVIAYSKYIGKFQRADLELKDSSNLEKMFSMNIKEGSVFAKWGGTDNIEIKEKIACYQQQQNSFYAKTSQLSALYKAMGVKTKSPKESIITSFKIKNETDLFNFQEDVMFTGFYSDLALCNSILDVGISFYLSQLEESRYDLEKMNKKTSNDEFYQVFQNQELKEYINQTYIEPMKESLKNSDLQNYKNLKFDFIWSSQHSLMMLTDYFFDLCNILEKTNGKIPERLHNLYLDQLVAINEERFEDATESLKKINYYVHSRHNF